MTQISRDDVLHLAQLSNLQLGTDELESLTIDIGNILKHVEELDKLNTEGVEPTYQVHGLVAAGRGDEVIDSGVSREQLLVRAPESANNQVKVPKVL